jgi:hypothetical protein
MGIEGNSHACAIHGPGLPDYLGKQLLMPAMDSVEVADRNAGIGIRAGNIFNAS